MDQKPNNQTTLQSAVQIALVLLLVIAAFFIGMLWTKVQSLEKGSAGSGNVAQGNNANGQNAPDPTQVGDIEPVNDKDHVFGDPNAKVVMIEYSDYQCPFCKAFDPTAKQLLNEFKGQVKWVYRQFPLESIHPNSREWAIAGECAAKVGGNDAFWKFTDAMFQTDQSSIDVNKIASQVGLNASAFKSCNDKKETNSIVDSHLQSGQKAGINGTPGAVMWNLETGAKEMVPGAVPYTTLKATFQRVASK